MLTAASCMGKTRHNNIPTTLLNDVAGRLRRRVDARVRDYHRRMIVLLVVRGDS